MTVRSRSALVTDFSVGFVLFVATLAVVGALFTVGGPDDVFGNASKYVFDMPSAAGLKVGSIVELRGFQAGVVSSIDLPPEGGPTEQEFSAGVQLTLSVNRKYGPHIRRDSFAWVQTRGLLGDAVVAIGGGSMAQPPLEPGERIPYKIRPLLDEIAGEAISENTAGMLGEIMELLKALNEGKGTLGQLLKNDSLYKSIEEFSHTLAQAGKQVQGLSEELEETLSQIRTQKGSLGKLIADSELYDEATSVLRRLNGVFAEDGLLGEGSASGILATLLRDPEAAKNFVKVLATLRSSSEKLDDVLTLLHEGRGSLGMALHDPSLAAGLRDVLVGVREADTLLNLVRNAERLGREQYLKDLDHSQDQAREARRVKALAASERGDGDERVVGAGGQPIPATSREESTATPTASGSE